MAATPSITRRSLAVAAGTVLLLGAGIGTSQAGGAAASHKVTVCHATGSDTNPFVLITVDRRSAAYKGHRMHHDDPRIADRPDLIDGIDGRIRTLKDCVQTPVYPYSTPAS